VTVQPLTAAYKIRSEIIPCKNAEVKEASLCALDIGYSAVKGFSTDYRFCIPSYVREHSGEILGTPRNTDILYKDENGTIFAVGSLALESLTPRDTNEASNTMFNRNRYFSPTFLTLARVGMAIGVGDENYEKRPIVLQTGLPPAYRQADTELLKEALAGEHKFSLKIGNHDWRDYDFFLNGENIFVIDQPIGSVYSASKKNDGSTVYCNDGKTYIDYNVLVLDGGFGTLDIFSVKNRSIDSTNTFNDLGMKAIYEGAAQEIFERYGKEVYAHTLQNYMEEGTITVFDRKRRATQEKDITQIIAKHTKLVCEKALNKIESAYDNLENYDYLLVTGGTGAAWYNQILARYKNMETLTVIPANQNDKISPVYNNVRGYYIFRALNLLANR
jgi:plasmid segregation protein ParM